MNRRGLNHTPARLADAPRRPPTPCATWHAAYCQSHKPKRSLFMPNAKKQYRPRSRVKTLRTRSTSGSNARSLTNEQVFLNIGVSKRTRAGLNKLVSVMNVTSQRDVLDQLIATELHRRNMRLPRGRLTSLDARTAPNLKPKKSVCVVPRSRTTPTAANSMV